MPIPSDYREICELLLQATNAGRVHWREIGSGSFSINFEDFKLEIWSGSDEAEGEFIAMGIKNPKSRGLVDNWYLPGADIDFVFFRSLYEAAKRQARNIPQKLQTIRDLLKGGGEIGLKEEDDPF